MRIDIQVRNRTAAELARVEAALKRVETNTSRLGATNARTFTGLNRASQSLERYGKNLQWTGRQLEYNFTIPLVLAGAAATKFALDNERAGTRLQKVYGDTSAEFQRLSQTEIPALRKAFEALSNEFGVNQAEVVEIGAAWAAAGSSGAALAKQTRLTLQTMILGEMEHKEAVEALIAIQSQYGLSAKELQATLAALNITENETAINFADLVQVFTRAAASARTAGVDIRHLAAMASTLVPAAGSAAKAGNALRTIISRIMAPTEDAAKIMAEMGLNINSAAVAGMSASERLEFLASKFVNLTGAQQAQASALMASRHQITGFDKLMQDIASGTGNYAKTLRITEGYLNDTSAAQQTFNKEIGIFLRSSPQAFKILSTQLQNLLARIILPLLPVMLALGSKLVALVDRFQELSPGIQQVVIAGLALLAIVGPLVRYTGAFIVLFARLGSILHVVGVGLLGLALGFGKLVGGIGRVHGKLKETAPFRWFLVNVKGFLGFLVAVVGDAFMLVARAAIGAFVALMPAMVLRMRLLVAVLGATIMGIGPLITRAWVFVAGGSAAAWTLFNNLVVTSWLGLQSILVTVGGAIQSTWAFVATASAFAWKAASGTVIALWAGLLTMSTIIGSAVSSVWWATTVGWTAAWSAAILAVRTMWTGLLTTAVMVGRMTAFALVAPAALSGAVSIIMGAFSAAFGFIVSAAVAAGPAILAALTSPWTALVALVVGIIAIFRKQIAAFIRFVINGFGVIPGAVVNAFQSVLRVLTRIFGAIARLFGVAMNPLGGAPKVETPKVPQGLSTAAQQAPEPPPEPASVRAASAPDQIGGAREAASASDKMAPEIKAASEAIKALAANIRAAKREANSLSDVVDRQRAVVDLWKSRLDAVSKALSVASDRLRDLGEVGIAGQRAMSDAIFENEMAQKRLRLEILRMGDAGQTIDDYKNKLAGLAGDLEMLRGEQADLRLAGAGSDVTGFIDAQIAALESQQSSIEAAMSATSPAAGLQAELDALVRQGEILDLENALQFDPLIRQLDLVTNGVRELPFNELLTQMRSAQSEVSLLTAEQSRLQAVHDAEQERLEGMRGAYEAATDKVRDMEAAMAELRATESTLRDAGDVDRVSPAVQAFRDSAGGDYPDVGGGFTVGREGGMADQSVEINRLAEEWSASAAQEFGNFDIFAPVKDQVGRLWKDIADGTEGVFGPLGAAITKVVDWLAGLWDQFTKSAVAKGALDGLSQAAQFLGWVWDQIGPGVISLLKTIGSFISNFFDAVGKELENWAPLWGDLVQAVGNILKVLGVVIGAALVVIIAIWKAVWPVLVHVLKPVLDMVVGVVRAALQILRGIITVILAIINGEWSKVWTGLLTILDGVWDAIYAVFKGAIGIVVGIVRGLVEGVINLFTWLWDMLVGHSIIPDMMNAIVWWFKFLWNSAKVIFDVIVAVIRTAWEVIAAVIGFIWTNVIMPIWAMIKWYIENVLVPAFHFVSAVVGMAFNAIGKVISFVWTTIIKPLWELIKWYIEFVLVPVFNFVLAVVRSVFDNIGKAISFAWNNVVKPIWDGIKWFIDFVLAPAFTSLKDRITTAFNGIKDIASTVWSSVTSTITHAVNIIIRAINTLIGGLRKVGDVLNIGFLKNLGDLPLLAAGGAVGGGPLRQLAAGDALNFAPVGHGFVTKGPKAIVGEGRPAYPEYVIPTDPQYRKRAQGLATDLGEKIGLFSHGGTLQLTGAQVGSLGYRAGWRGGDLATAIAVAFRESMWNARAHNDNRRTGDDSYGLYQINMIDSLGPARRAQYGLPNNDALLNPETNTAVARHMQGAQGWRPWSTYNRGSHVSVMPYATEIAKAIEAQGGRVNPNDSPVDFIRSLIGGVFSIGADVLFNPIADAAKSAMNHVSVPFLRDMGHGTVEAVRAWVKDKASMQYGGGAVGGLPGAYGNLVGDGFARTGGYGARILGVLSANTRDAANFVRSSFGVRDVGTLGQRSNTSDHPWGKALDAMTYSDKAKGTQIARWFATNNARFGTKYVIWHDQINTGSGWRSYTHPSGNTTNPTLAHRDHVHVSFLEQGGQIPSLAHGGVIRPRPGGTIVRVAEAGRSERATMIEPLDGNGRGLGGGKTENHFYGDLVFPNVRNGDDAEEFIRNLGALID